VNTRATFLNKHQVESISSQGGFCVHCQILANLTSWLSAYAWFSSSHEMAVVDSGRRHLGSHEFGGLAENGLPPE
jgi:hypothetical protein